MPANQTVFDAQGLPLSREQFRHPSSASAEGFRVCDRPRIAPQSPAAADGDFQYDPVPFQFDHIARVRYAERDDDPPFQIVREAVAVFASLMLAVFLWLVMLAGAVYSTRGQR